MQRLQSGHRSEPLAAGQHLRRPKLARHPAKPSGKQHRGLLAARHAPSSDCSTLTRASVHARPRESAPNQPGVQTHCTVNAGHAFAHRAAAMAAALAVSVGALCPPVVPAASAMQPSSGAAAAHLAQRYVGPPNRQSPVAGADDGVVARESADSTARHLSRSQLRQTDVLHGSTAQVIGLERFAVAEVAPAIVNPGVLMLLLRRRLSALTCDDR